MRPQVSVIVPVYNADKFLESCLESLVCQTLESIEIIVVNDGSTDGSQEIIDRYTEKYPQIKAYKKENTGIADTRNFGLSKVTGEYLAFLDSDDTADRTMLEKMIKKAKETDADVVVSHFMWTFPNERKIQKEGPYPCGKLMMIHLFATLWNKIYKTEFIQQTGLQFPNGNRYEDAYFLYCLVPWIKRVEFIDEAFVSYIQHDASITHTNNDQVKNMITVFQLIVEYYKKHGLFEQYFEELEYIHIRFFLGNSFLRSAQIEDKKDRKETILLGWNLLNQQFPKWRKNHYLKDLGGMKNSYFRLVSRWNLMIFAALFKKRKKNADSD